MVVCPDLVIMCGLAALAAMYLESALSPCHQPSPSWHHLMPTVQTLITGAQLPRMSCADILFHILQARTLRCISNRNLWWAAWSCTVHCIRIKPDIALVCNPGILVELSSMILCQWMSQNSWLTHLTEFSPTIWQIITDLWFMDLLHQPVSGHDILSSETPRNQTETWIKGHLLVWVL